MRMVREEQAGSGKPFTGGTFLAPEQERAIAAAVDGSAFVGAVADASRSLMSRGRTCGPFGEPIYRG